MAHSTENTLETVTEKALAARSAKLASVIKFLNLSEAFDTINHNVLLSILMNLGNSGTAGQWFASYLEGWSYQVTWRGATSTSWRLSTVVPQGSVLGSLLLCLHLLCQWSHILCRMGSHITDLHLLLFSLRQTCLQVSQHIYQTFHHGWQLIIWN